MGVVNNRAAKSVINFGENACKNLAVSKIVFGIFKD
jgi:hypothetical protein